MNDVPNVNLHTGKTGILPFFSELGRKNGVNPFNISDLPVDFSGAPTTGRVPLLVFFIDLTKGSPTKWDWDFGDGSTGVGEHVLHEYSKGGIYTVQLKASDQNGYSGSRVKEQYITVNPVPINANFTATPSRGQAPLTVEFTDHSTGAMVWSWAFGDGSPGSMIPNPSHTFSQTGTYSVHLTIANELGHSDTATQEIVVSSPDVLDADFVATPTSGTVPLVVQFSDRSTGVPTTWSWDFGDSTTGMVSSPVHTYQASGLYPVTLTVSDQSGNSDTEQKTGYISVLDIPQPSGSIPVSAGWNFVSVPKKLKTGKDTAAIFENIDADGHSLLQYDSLNNQWSILTRTNLIKPLNAVWLYSKKIDTVPLTFDSGSSQNPPTRDLLKGWNAVGFTGFESRSANKSLFSVQKIWLSCLGFNREQQKYDEMIINGENDDTPIHPYNGYWIYMSDDGVLAGIS